LDVDDLLIIYFFQIIKPFLNERIKKSITFQPDLQSLHRSVDPEILPKELGGSQGSFDNSACFKSYKSTMLSYFENVKKYVEMSKMKNGK
jgi:hypothetical protein